MRPSFFNTYFVCVTERDRVYVSICVLRREGDVETVRVWELTLVLNIRLVKLKRKPY